MIPRPVSLDEILVAAWIMDFWTGFGDVGAKIYPEQAHLQAYELLCCLRQPPSQKGQVIDEICADLRIGESDASEYLENLIERHMKEQREKEGLAK